jgi:hypothetical protein
MTGRRASYLPLSPARHLLAGLVALCLITVGAPVVAGAAHSGPLRGESMTGATSQGVSALRGLPERVAAHGLPAKPLPFIAVLPSALLVALLLVLSTPRRIRTGPARQAELLSAAGRGPPSPS